MRLALLLVALTAALGLVASGGDDEEAATTEAATTEATTTETTDAASEEAAVEEAVIAYGEADGPDTCEFVSQEAIDSIGGLENCEREFEDATPTVYEVREIEVDGEQALATVYRPETDQTERITLVNEDGEWKVDPTR